MISAAALPKSYEEFAQKKEWAGKTAIDGTDSDWLKGFFQHFGEAKATQIIKGMVGTLNPVITDGHLALARSVGAGEYWLSLNNYVMLSSNVQLAGGPIEIFPLDPVVLFFAGVAVNAKAKSPNAARLAANFLLSQDGQGHLAKFGRLPTRGDVQSNPPGILERLHAKAVVPALFRTEDERKWQQTFNRCSSRDDARKERRLNSSISRRGVTADWPASLLARAACAAHAERPWLDPKLLAAAKKEGPLTVYSSTNEQEGLPLFKIFTTRPASSSTTSAATTPR